MKEPPEILRDSKLFARSMKLIYPIYLGATWLYAVSPTPSLTAIFASKTLIVVGLFSEFFAAALLAWGVIHMGKALSKLEECTEYDLFLTEIVTNRNKENFRENHEINENIRKNRKRNSIVRSNAEEYPLTKVKFDLWAFIALGVGAFLQILGTLVQ